MELYKTAAPGTTRQILLSALAKIAMHASADDAVRQRIGALFRANAAVFEAGRRGISDIEHSTDVVFPTH
jgi:hypothetical protein